jgi:hypothetical protein
MGLDKSTIVACAASIGVLVFLIAGGVTMGLRSDEPEFLSRAGALVVAESLILTVWQFWYERTAERRRTVMAERMPMRPASSGWAATARVAVGESAHGEGSFETKIWRSRVCIFGTAIMLGFVGEVLHGWGDMMISNWTESRHMSCASA